MKALTSRAGLSFSLALSAIVSLVLSPATLAEAPSDSCQPVAVLDSGEAWTSGVLDTTGASVLAVQVPEPGWLALEAESLGSTGSGAAWMEVLSLECGGDTLALSAPSQTLGKARIRVRDAGTLFLRVGSVAPPPLGEIFSLHLATVLFAEGRTSLTHLSGADGEPGDDTEEEDGEILPLNGPGTPAGQGSLQSLFGDRKSVV